MITVSSVSPLSFTKIFLVLLQNRCFNFVLWIEIKFLVRRIIKRIIFLHQSIWIGYLLLPDQKEPGSPNLKISILHSVCFFIRLLIFLYDMSQFSRTIISLDKEHTFQQNFSYSNLIKDLFSLISLLNS